jgi:hypothetical protein
MTVLGVLRSVGGLEWDLTEDDALWLARAIVGESIADAAAVASTMLRRLAYVSDRQNPPARLWPSLAFLLRGDEERRGYSQPVSVYWSTRGSASAQARRARISSMSWDEIPPSVRDVVLGMLTGRMPLVVPGAVHFAAPAEAARFLENTPGSARVGGGRNWFLSMPGSRRYEPQIIGGGPPLAQPRAAPGGRRGAPAAAGDRMKSGNGIDETHELEHVERELEHELEHVEAPAVLDDRAVARELVRIREELGDVRLRLARLERRLAVGAVGALVVVEVVGRLLERFGG